MCISFMLFGDFKTAGTKTKLHFPRPFEVPSRESQEPSKILKPRCWWGRESETEERGELVYCKAAQVMLKFVTPGGLERNLCGLGRRAAVVLKPWPGRF